MAITLVVGRNWLMGLWSKSARSNERNKEKGTRRKEKALHRFSHSVRQASQHPRDLSCFCNKLGSRGPVNELQAFSDAEQAAKFTRGTFCDRRELNVFLATPSFISF